MPLFEVTDSTGRRFEVEGDREPTAEELEQLFASVGQADAAAESKAAAQYSRPTRDEIAADVEAKTAAAAESDTWTKATSALAGGAVRALTDPILGAGQILGRSGIPDWAISGQMGQIGAAARLLAPLISAGADAETVARGTPGNETVAEVAGAVGSGLGSMPAAMVPGAGPAMSAVSAGLQSYEQTRREALAVFQAAAIPDEEAQRSAHRVALGAGTITGTVTGLMNRYAPALGLGRGVERGLGGAARKLTIEELKKSALRPMVVEALRETGGEATEEAIDQALQEGLVRWQYDSSQTLGDAIRNVVKAGALGGVAGGVIGGVPGAAGVLGERRQAIRGIREGSAESPEAASTPATAADQVAQPQIDLGAPAVPPTLKDRAPGTYVQMRGQDGRLYEAVSPTITGNVEATKAYMERAVPGATVLGITVVEAPAAPAGRPGPAEDNLPSDGVTPAGEQPAGVVAPDPTQGPTDESQAQGSQEGVLTPPPSPAQPAPEAPAGPGQAAAPPVAGPPPAKPNRGLESIRAMEAGRPPDFLDWIAENVGRIRSKSKASEATAPYYSGDFEAAAAGSNRNLFGASGTEIDVVAQMAADAQQISDPTPDAVWAAMAAARTGRAAYRQQQRELLAEGREVASQADRFERAAIEGKRDGRLPDRRTMQVAVDDLLPGDTFNLAGETVTVERFVFDPDTDEMTALELSDGRKFGVQVVAAGTMLQVDSGSLVRTETSGPVPGDVVASPDAPFSLRQPDAGGGDFFAAPESVEQQRARQELEAERRKKAEDRQKMLDRQAAPLVGRPVDTTGDMFDPMASEAPLFAQPARRPSTPAGPARPVQGDLLSTRAGAAAAAPNRSMTPDQVTGFLARIFGGVIPRRIVVSPEARRTAAGALVEGVYDTDSDVVTLYAPNLRGEADVRRVMRHELLHAVYKDAKVAASWRTLRAMLTRKDVERARGEGYTDHAREEAALDIVEARVSKKESRFRRWVGAIVDALNRKGAADWAGAVFGLERLADSDARLLVRYAERLDRAEKSPATVIPSPSVGERFSLRSVLADPSAMSEEVERQKTAGRVVTPAVSELAHDGVAVADQMGPDVGFRPWSDAMVKRHGEPVRPLLRAAWAAVDSLRYSLGSGIPPEAVADINRIIATGEAAVDPANLPATPVYDPEKTSRWWMAVARPSDVIRYFAGDALLKRRGELELRTAYQTAAVRRQSEALLAQLEDSFYGDRAGPILRAVRRFMPRARLRRFMRLALPIAAHLNVTGGEPGAFVFEDFEMRAGFMPEAEANKHGITTGEVIWRANPVTGEMDTLTLGAKIELDSGSKGYQLLRPMPAARQQAVYEWARNEFPEFEWFLNTFIDPRLKDTRVTYAGVEIPIFNRFALASRYTEGDPTFQSRPAYTPEVAIGMGLLRRFVRARKVTFREGNVSPGRKYETGTGREAGNVLDLLSGFNVRAMQVLQEDVRKTWTQAVLGAAAEVPQGGPPAGWVLIENAMATVWQAVQTMRKFDDPIEFPQTTERLRDDETPAYKRFFGELMRLRRADKPLMLPERVVKALLGDFVVTQELSFAAKLAQVWARNWKAFLLLMPDTFIENRTDNYLRLLMQAHRQLTLAAVRGGDRLAFAEARRLAWAGIVNIVPGVRQVFGLNSERLFQRVVVDVLPDEVFEGQTRMQDLWVEKGTTEEEIASLQQMGRPGQALLTAARDVGPLILEKTGYGKIDVRAKQQFAFTVLLARAEHEAWRRGLRGAVRDGFIEAWMLRPPEAAVVNAVAGANRLLLNYKDAPGLLSAFARIPGGNTLVAFPMFRYHWIGREIDRATSAFRAAHRLLIRGKKLSREEWAASLADTISYVLLPVLLYPASKIAGALSDSLIGAGDGEDDDDKDPRNLVGASSVFETTDDGGIRRKPLARELVVANRLNVSRMLRMAGVDLGGEADYWWHVKDYPLIRSAALMYLAAEDARAHGAKAGIVTLSNGMEDLLSSLTGLGQAVKIPAKIRAEMHSENSGTAVATQIDPYATNVPLSAYITLQALNLLPAQRQADEVIKWLDPVPRRITRSNALGYDPGVVEAMQVGGWTGLADRLARGAMSGDFSSPLPPQGRINRRMGIVEEPREFDLRSRIAAILGQNIKPVPRAEYQEAVSGGAE